MGHSVRIQIFSAESHLESIAAAAAPNRTNCHDTTGGLSDAE
jgi:hypothetical protein